MNYLYPNIFKNLSCKSNKLTKKNVKIKIGNIVVIEDPKAGTKFMSPKT